MQEWKFPKSPDELTSELLTAVLAADRSGLEVHSFEVVETFTGNSG